MQIKSHSPNHSHHSEEITAIQFCEVRVHLQNLFNNKATPLHKPCQALQRGHAVSGDDLASQANLGGYEFFIC